MNLNGDNLKAVEEGSPRGDQVDDGGLGQAEPILPTPGLGAGDVVHVPVDGPEGEPKAVMAGPGGPTLRALAIRYLAEREARHELRPLSVRTMHYALATFLRSVGSERNPSRLNRRDIERWMERDTLSPASLRSQLSIVRGFCRWLVERGYAKKDPTAGIRNPKQPRRVPRALRPPQVDAVLSAVPDARAALIVSLEVQEGLRCCEVAGLQLGDVDFVDRALIVGEGKGGHERVLPLSEETFRYMVRYLEEHPAKAGPLIRSYSHPSRGLCAKYVSNLVSRWIHGAGVPASAHALRHTMASDVLKGGAHLRDVQAALGHSSIATTERYLPLLVGDLRKAMGGRRYRGGDGGVTRTKATPDTARRSPTLTGLALAYVDQRSYNLSPSTLQGFRYNLVNFTKAVSPEPNELTTQQIEKFLGAFAPATARNRLSQIRLFCRWMVKHGHLRLDPSLEVQRRRQPRLVPRALKHDEARALVLACPDARAKLVILLMLQEGLRRKEVVGLTIGDLDLNERLMLVRGKSNHERVLPISEETWSALESYQVEWPATAGPLIRSYTDGRSAIGASYLGHLVVRWMTEAGIKRRARDGRSAHACRHSAATDMLRSGAHVRDVQAALGHASLEATERYLPWIVDDLRSAMAGRSYRSGAVPDKTLTGPAQGSFFDRKCAHCDTPLRTANRRALYCSDRCKEAEARERRREQREKND